MYLPYYLTAIKLSSKIPVEVWSRKGKHKKMTKKYVLHYHHDILFEPLEGTLEDRIKYIKENKPKEERATRLRLIRLLTDEEMKSMPLEAWEKAREAWEAVLNSPSIQIWHKKICVSDCPWSGMSIFPSEIF